MRHVILGLFFASCLTSAIPAHSQGILGQMFGVPPRQQTYINPGYGSQGYVDQQKAQEYGYRNTGDFRDDTALSQQAETRALNGGPYQPPVRWANRRTGNYGTVTVVGSGTNQFGWPCVTLTQSIVIFGRQDESAAAACRSPQGYWQRAER